MSGRNLPALELAGVSVDYGSRHVLRDVQLSVAPAETLALLGPSGAGKTTLLYAVAGFIDPATGTIRLGGREVASPQRSVPPERRDVAMVFQHYGLWPHMDALATVAYPLRRAGVGRRDAEQQAQALLERLGVGGLAQRRPAEMSGGEQQRVGLARALARSPRLYLLDEPTAHLDAALRSELQEVLEARRADGHAAAIHATHDVEEALALADRVALLRAGRIVQVGTPTDVYEKPVDEWAAQLTGPASFVEWAGVRHLVRPDWVELAGPLRASVAGVRFRGSHTDYTLTTDSGRLTARASGPPRLAAGGTTSVAIRRSWPLAQPAATPGQADVWAEAR